jgi:hypothetical protein
MTPSRSPFTGWRTCRLPTQLRAPPRASRPHPDSARMWMHLHPRGAVHAGPESRVGAAQRAGAPAVEADAGEEPRERPQRDALLAVGVDQHHVAVAAHARGAVSAPRRPPAARRCGCCERPMPVKGLKHRVSKSANGDTRPRRRRCQIEHAYL